VLSTGDAVDNNQIVTSRKNGIASRDGREN